MKFTKGTAYTKDVAEITAEVYFDNGLCNAKLYREGCSLSTLVEKRRFHTRFMPLKMRIRMFKRRLINMEKNRLKTIERDIAANKLLCILLK